MSGRGDVAGGLIKIVGFNEDDAGGAICSGDADGVAAGREADDDGGIAGTGVGKVEGT